MALNLIVSAVLTPVFDILGIRRLGDVTKPEDYRDEPSGVESASLRVRAEVPSEEQKQ